MAGLLEMYSRWFGGAKADPEAMDTPVYPIVHAVEVTVEVHAVNGVRWNEPLLSDALEDFGRYLSGEVRIITGPALALDGAADGSVTWEQVDSMVGSLPLRGPFHIAMVIVPRIRDRGVGYCIWRPDGGYCVVIQSMHPPERARFRWLAAWYRYAQRSHIVHELCHTLHLPSRKHHRAALEHCTNTSCVLFPWGNFRVWAKAMMHGFGRPGLCRECFGELQEGMADHRPPGTDAVMDWYTQRVKLNPTAARAYAYRGEEYLRRGQLDEAITDLSRAIELDDQTAAWFSFRGLLYMRSKQRAAALEDLRRCLVLRPDNPFAKANLDELLASSPADGTEAGGRDGI